MSNANLNCSIVTVNECVDFVIFFMILKMFEKFNNFEWPTKVKHNAATKARLPRIESHDSWLSIRCGPSSVFSLFFNFVAVLKFRDYLENVTKHHEFSCFLLY